MENALIYARKGLIALLLLLPLTTELVSAKTYRWTDADGNVVYSQVPPRDGREATTVGAPPPPAESPEVAKQRLQEQIERLNQQRESRNLSKQQAQESKQQAEASAKNCEMARHNLEALRQGTRRLYRNKDGSYSRLTEEEVNSRAQETKSFIAENCK